MKKISSYLVMLGLFPLQLFAGTPLVEFIATPNSTQYLKPQNSSILYYTLRNNTDLTLPLDYQLSSSAAMVISAGNTCNQAIAGHSTCVLAIQYQAPSINGNDKLVLHVNYQGRAPLVDVITINVDSNLACSLLPTASYQTPFCQNQYQKVLQYSTNVFNLTNQNVVEEQTLGGVFGIYQNQNNVEQICYVSCGYRSLNGTPPDENTLFELASVTKTLTTSIFGKLVANGTISSALNAVASSLPPGFSLSANENQVTFQQLATFSGGVCFSDAPSVDQSGTNQVTNQNNFVTNINSLDPDPTTSCVGGGDNIHSEYGTPPGTPPFLPSHNFYSNSSVGLLGQALMHIQNYGVLEPGFNDWMCANLIDVLDMDRTSACLPDEAHDGTCASASNCAHKALWSNSEYASGYHVFQNSYELGSPFLFMPWAPAGGIRSNATDMVKFIRANLGFSTNSQPAQLQLVAGMQLAHQGNNYLPAPSTVRPNIGSQTPLLGPQGFAWVCMDEPNSGDTLCGKIGGHKNFRSFVGLNKDKNYGIVILFNTGALSTKGSFKTLVTPPSIGVIGVNLMENIG